MTVFKGYFRIMKRNMGLLLMYFAIFLGMTLIVSTMSGKDGQQTRFQNEKLKIAVIDRDGGTAAKGLAAYVEASHERVELQDQKEVLQEELFYRNVDYIVYIPENFEQVCLTEGKPLSVTKVPDSANGYYGDQCMNAFLNSVRVWISAGYSSSEAVEKTVELQTERPRVELVESKTVLRERPGYAYIFQYLPYLYIYGLCYTVGILIRAFREREIKRRMACSAITLGRQNAEALLACAVIGAVFWIIGIFLPVPLYGAEYLQNPNLGLYCLNALAMAAVGLSFAFFLGAATQNANVINGVVNAAGLVMCFMGGVFLPMEFLGEGVRKAAYFMPVYWYEVVNEQLAGYAGLTGEALLKIWQGLGIQLLFGAACIGAALALIRYRSVEKE